MDMNWGFRSVILVDRVENRASLVPGFLIIEKIGSITVVIDMPASWSTSLRCDVRSKVVTTALRRTKAMPEKTSQGVTYNDDV